jgi:hypothetical protein
VLTIPRPPKTNEGWEGTGVAPHIAVPAEQALTAAHMAALDGLLADEEIDDDARFRLTWARDGLECELHPVTLPAEEMQAYLGTYGPRRVYLEEGELWYQREDRPPYRLEPMGDDRFLVGDLDYFRLSFERDEEGRVDRIVGNYDNGQTDAHERDSDVSDS